MPGAPVTATTQRTAQPYAAIHIARHGCAEASRVLLGAACRPQAA